VQRFSAKLIFCGALLALGEGCKSDEGPALDGGSAADAAVCTGACAAGTHRAAGSCSCIANPPDVDGSPRDLGGENDAAADSRDAETEGAAQDATADLATPIDSTTDGSQSKEAGDAAASCRSVEQACQDPKRLPCVVNWASAQDPKAWCANWQVTYGANVQIYDCNGVRAVVLMGVDTSTAYFYDPRSGALTGIEGRGIAARLCVAGMPPGDGPACGPLRTGFCPLTNGQ
jgi:hypothetical protein